MQTEEQKIIELGKHRQLMILQIRGELEEDIRRKVKAAGCHAPVGFLKAKAVQIIRGSFEVIEGCNDKEGRD